jgi:CubicO group peptidase (beta-lactamase class C family)
MGEMFMKYWQLSVFLLLLLPSCTKFSITEFNSLDDIIINCETQLPEIVGKNIPGAVIVFIKDGEIYYSKAFGYKNISSKDIMTTDTIFQAASISKTISAIGVMKLVEEKKIEIDRPVEFYLTRWHIPD